MMKVNTSQTTLIHANHQIPNHKPNKNTPISASLTTKTTNHHQTLAPVTKHNQNKKNISLFILGSICSSLALTFGILPILFLMTNHLLSASILLVGSSVFIGCILLGIGVYNINYPM